jgi:subtilisin family serine protease
MGDQKIENQLNLALNLPERVRQRTLELDVGFNEELSLWELIVKYNGDIARLSEELGIGVEILTNQYAILTVPERLINIVSDYPEVEFVEKPKQLFYALEASTRAACIRRLHEAPYNLTGEGVLVAIIDSGIDYTHPDFRNEDGTTRIVELWDQTIPGNPPPGYELGSIFTREQINEALSFPTLTERLAVVPSVDISGHGTHVAGIAAGNGRASNMRNRGVAPDSELLIVKLGVPADVGTFPRTTELMRAISYVIYKAEELGRPVAVNLSFGNNYGGHDGSSLLETFINDMSNVWKSVIVIGSGNEGAAAHHASGVLTEGQVEIIEMAVGPAESNLNIQLWKEYYDNFDISIVNPSGIRVGPFTRRLGTQRFIVGRTEIFVYYGEPQPYNKAQEIYLDFVPIGQYIDPGVWRIELNPIRLVVGNYNLWLPTREVLNAETRFLRPSILTTLTIPSTAMRPITVGAYNSVTNSAADFSGRGYTRELELVKPEIVAPGVNIVAPAPGGGYDTKSGTSMATPFVTGSAALLMQWGIVEDNDPFLYGERVKAYLLDGTRKLGIAPIYPNPSLGYGALCLQESFERAIFVLSLNEGIPEMDSDHEVAFNLPAYIKGYDNNLIEVGTTYLKKDYQLKRPLAIAGYYLQQTEKVSKNNLEMYNLNRNFQERDKQKSNMLQETTKWLNPFLSIFEQKENVIYLLDMDRSFIHPLDFKELMNHINDKMIASDSFLILNHQFIKNTFSLNFSPKERYKQLKLDVFEYEKFFSIWIYGYALDDFSLFIQSPEQEVLALDKLNVWKEDKNLLDKSGTTIIGKYYQKDKISPFLIKLDFMNLQKGYWKIAIEGKVIIDGRMTVIPSCENDAYELRTLDPMLNLDLGERIVVVEAQENNTKDKSKQFVTIPIQQLLKRNVKQIPTKDRTRLASLVAGITLSNQLKTNNLEEVKQLLNN